MHYQYASKTTANNTVNDIQIRIYEMEINCRDAIYSAEFLYQHFLTYIILSYTIISECIRKKSVGNVVINTGVPSVTNNTVFIDIWMNLNIQPTGNTYIGKHCQCILQFLRYQ